MDPRKLHSRQSTTSSIAYTDLPRPRPTPRRQTFPFEKTTRQKPRRWPLALRFIKGSIHQQIVIPVSLHAVFATLVVVADQHFHLRIGLPPSIIPSLSIVVGLMLVFRNQTAYARFWEGRMLLSTIITCCRNLTRCFITTSYSSTNSAQQPPTASRQVARADTERTIRYLLALLVSTKNHLRGNWGGFSGLSSRAPSPMRKRPAPQPRLPDANAFLRNRGRWRGRRHHRVAELSDLVPSTLVGYEDRGLGVPLQFAALIEAYIKRGFERGWWNAPTSSQHTAQLNALVDAYGKMETIRLTPVPVALLIHQKQVLALFGAVLPFAMVTTLGWWAIPISALVVFTLYGIDGIASQLEDPFGYDRADIDMDSLVEDIRTETLTLLDEWHRVGAAEGEVVATDDRGTDTPMPTSQSSASLSGLTADGVATEDWHRAGDGSGLTSATTTAAASGPASMSASALLERRRGEEGGEWFTPGEGLGQSLSWRNAVRFTDEPGDEA